MSGFAFWLLYSLLVLTVPKPSSAASLADKYVPPDLDPKGQYRTYSADELYDSLADVAGINNSFIGMKVKIFGKYVEPNSNLHSRVGNGYGCDQTLCDHIDNIMFLSVSKQVAHTLTIRDPFIMQYYSNNAFIIHLSMLARLIVLVLIHVTSG